jgi:Protein of unknown function (DUF2793).
MTTSADFGLPFIALQQAQPEVTHNEALYLLQALLNGVIDRGQNAPPAALDGDAFIVGAAPTGAWAGRANCVAIYTAGGWRFVPGSDSNGSPIVMGARQKGMHVVLRGGSGSPTEIVQAIWSGSAWGEYRLTPA